MGALDEATGDAGRREELLERLRRTRVPHRGERRHRQAAPDAATRAVPAVQGARGLLRGEPGRLVRGRPVRAVASPTARDGRAAGRRGPRADTEPGWLRDHHRRVRPERTRPGRIRSRTRRSTAWSSRCATPATPVRNTSGTSCSPRTAGSWLAWWRDRSWRRSVNPAWRTSARRSRRPPSARPGYPGETGRSADQPSSPSTTCRRRTRGTRGWPRPCRCSGRW